MKMKKIDVATLKNLTIEEMKKINGGENIPVTLSNGKIIIITV